MRTIRSFVVVLSLAAAMACQTVSGGTMAPASVPGVAPASVAATPAAASSRKGRTILVLALLAGLVVAAILVSSSSDDGGIY